MIMHNNYVRYPLVIILCIAAKLSFAQDTLIKVKDNLIGRWDWIRTEVVDRGGVANLSACHCQKYLIFKTNNIVDQYINDLIVKSADYSLDKSFFLNDPIKIIIHSSVLSGQIIMKEKSFGAGPFGGYGSLDYYAKQD